MLFSELLASILNGKKKKISVAVVKKKPQIFTTRFHKALRDVILVFPNNEISTPLSLLFLMQNSLLLENTNMAFIRHDHSPW